MDLRSDPSVSTHHCLLSGLRKEAPLELHQFMVFLKNTAASLNFTQNAFLMSNNKFKRWGLTFTRNRTIFSRKNLSYFYVSLLVCLSKIHYVSVSSPPELSADCLTCTWYTVMYHIMINYINSAFSIISDQGCTTRFHCWTTITYYYYIENVSQNFTSKNVMYDTDSVLNCQNKSPLYKVDKLKYIVQ